MSQSSNNLITQFWLCNISERDVSLSDLRVKVPAQSGINLLDKRHYSYTWEQLKESMESGSIYRKRNIIKIGKGPPQSMEPVQKTVSTRPIMIRKRTCVIVSEDSEYDDEFAFSDETYADELSKEFGEDF